MMWLTVDVVAPAATAQRVDVRIAKRPDQLPVCVVVDIGRPEDHELMFVNESAQLARFQIAGCAVIDPHAKRGRQSGHLARRHLRIVTSVAHPVCGQITSAFRKASISSWL